jgi:hypothetical protein
MRFNKTGNDIRIWQCLMFIDWSIDQQFLIQIRSGCWLKYDLEIAEIYYLPESMVAASDIFDMFQVLQKLICFT